MTTFLLYGVLAFLAYLFYYINNFNKKFNYFKEKGIPQVEIKFFNELIAKKEKKSHAEETIDYYWKFKKMGLKHGGIYKGSGKSWMPVDPELIKTILVKDFTYFSAHNPKMPGLFFNNIFHMDGEEWKDMRRKLTPTFTSGKMKMMFGILLEKSYGLVDLVEKLCKTGESAEIKELLARFTTDVIGSCGFGIECNSIEDINSEFFQQGQAIFKDNMKGPSRFKLFLMYLGLKKHEIPQFVKVVDFFREVVAETLKYREENKIIRKDFMHLMIQLKNKGTITELTNDNEDVYEKTVKNEVMSVDDIASECILFFSAGFETSSTTMSYTLLELTQNQDVQKKLRKEVREVLNRHNGKLTYEALQEMTYCDNVIHEALRKYPPIAILPRLCTKTYKIPGTDSTIEKGTSIDIPVWGLQMDPDYFPEPEKFNPDRFNNKNQFKEFTYLPFGEGPRMCLGLRFGVMQSKLGIATLINKYNFTLNKQTQYPPKFDKYTFIISVDGGIWLDVEKVD